LLLRGLLVLRLDSSSRRFLPPKIALRSHRRRAGPDPLRARGGGFQFDPARLGRRAKTPTRATKRGRQCTAFRRHNGLGLREARTGATIAAGSSHCFRATAFPTGIRRRGEETIQRSLEGKPLLPRYGMVNGRRFRLRNDQQFLLIEAALEWPSIEFCGFLTFCVGQNESPTNNTQKLYPLQEVLQAYFVRGGEGEWQVPVIPSRDRPAMGNLQRGRGMVRNVLALAASPCEPRPFVFLLYEIARFIVGPEPDRREPDRH